MLTPSEKAWVKNIFACMIPSTPSSFSLWCIVHKLLMCANLHDQVLIRAQNAWIHI